MTLSMITVPAADLPERCPRVDQAAAETAALWGGDMEQHHYQGVWVDDTNGERRHIYAQYTRVTDLAALHGTYTPVRCGHPLVWWDGEYDSNCILPTGHRPAGVHYDNRYWYDDHHTAIEDPFIPPDLLALTDYVRESA